jgi:pyruvate,water dikinase
MTNDRTRSQSPGESHVDAPVILPLSAEEASLEIAGGKGANLVKLSQAGFPAPGGFIVATAGYDAFVEANQLGDWILSQLQQVDATDPNALEALSRTIRARFEQSTMPAGLRDAILAAYAELGRPRVAVRSSATAEDLPDISFAGQQDTYLNVAGDESLLRSVIRCWSSLWTARAIGYRTRNQIDQRHVSLAVVVQKMVQSEASGVLFTANPLTGRRTETVIDATLGLGEALVSGLVEPDHFVIATRTGEIRERKLGAKALVIRGAEEGDTITEEIDASDRQAVPDTVLQELVKLGVRAQELFGAPQDMEWAWADGKLYILQSRPITSLYPLPEGVPMEPLRVFLSFGAIQGVLDPFTPLGRETIKGIFAGGARLFGFDFTSETQPVIHAAGERLWGEITGVFRNNAGRQLLLRALPGVEPGAGAGVKRLLQDPRLTPSAQLPSQATFKRLARFFALFLPQVLRGILWPEKARQQAQEVGAALIQEIQERSAAASTLAQRIELHELVAMSAFPVLIPLFLSRLIAAYGPMALLIRLAPDLAKADPSITGQTILGVTRGLPHNVTTEMDLALWQTAQAIRQNPEALQAMGSSTAEELAEAYLAQQLPASLQQIIGAFLDRYGMRGVGEIDLGRPRWRENPMPVVQALLSYLSIEDENMAPDAVFRRGEAEANKIIEQLAAAASRRPRGWLKSRIVRWAARRIRSLAGLRESPKFLIINMLGIVRQSLLESGQELAAAGVLQRSDDLFYLYWPELKVLAMGAPGDWQSLVDERRAAYAREQRRRQIPRILLSDGEAIYDGIQTDAAIAGDHTLTGSPVSPGMVEGVAHVVFDPHRSQLNPGEILVCPGTDPAWTPLFLAAGGLVMEVGGMMTHGAVVAREYGIPAVVGVDRATQRIQTGQKIRVNGSTGEIVILDSAVK